MKNTPTNLSMNFIFLFALINFFLLSNQYCFAQSTTGMCPDTTLIRQGFFCDTSNLTITAYLPVCGCDGKTYFNQCAALNYHGAWNFQSGPCEPIGFVLWPVPSNTDLNIVLAVKDLSTIVHVTIFAAADYKVCFDNSYSLANSPTGVETEPVNISTFPRGVYLVMARTIDGSYYAIHKFVKIPVY